MASIAAALSSGNVSALALRSVVPSPAVLPCSGRGPNPRPPEGPNMLPQSMAPPALGSSKSEPVVDPKGSDEPSGESVIVATGIPSSVALGMRLNIGVSESPSSVGVGGNSVGNAVELDRGSAGELGLPPAKLPPVLFLPEYSQSLNFKHLRDSKTYDAIPVCGASPI